MDTTILGRIRDFIRELTQIQQEEYRRVSIALYKSMSAVGTDFDTYRVPGTHKLAITGVRGHLAMIGMASEVLNLGNLTSNTSVQDRALMKAMNCRVALKNDDDNVKLTEGRDLSLADILELAGGKELDWADAPHVIERGKTIRADMTLVQSDAYVLGGATEYGVVINGILLRTRGD